MAQNIDQQPRPFDSKDFASIEVTADFNHFVRKKNSFLFTVAGIFLFIYILLPILAFTPILQKPVIGAITGVWLYSAMLFVMTIVLCMVYIRKASHFDKEAARVIDEYRAQMDKEAGL